MDIVLTTTIYPPDIGGPATYAQEIKKRLFERGYNLKIVTTSSTAAENKNVYKIPKKYNIKILGFLIHQIQLFLFLCKISRDVDCIYTLDPKYLGFISYLCGVFLRKPVILRFGGDRVWENAFNKGTTDENLEEFFNKSIKGINYLRFLFILQKFVMNSVDKIIVPSESIKKITVKFYKINPDKLTVIYNSIDLPDNLKLINKINHPTLLSVGRLINLKRVDMVIEVVKELSNDYPNIRLLIAGEGPEKANLIKLTSSINANHIVTFLGNVHRVKLNELYSCSDILVLNSLYETFSHVLIEAMCYKVAIVSSSKGGPEEIVLDNKTGLLVNNGNKKELKENLVRLIDDKILSDNLTENAYLHVKDKFTWEKNLIKLEDILEKTK